VAGDGAVIVKRVKKGGHGGHHGGAWKVAYADFVTAMMAFFLLMWLINTTTPEQKRGIADYFAPQSISQTSSGSGGMLGGKVVAQASAPDEGASKMEALEEETTLPPESSTLTTGWALKATPLVELPGDVVKTSLVADPTASEKVGLEVSPASPVEAALRL